MEKTRCLVSCALQSVRLQSHSQVQGRAARGQGPRVTAASDALSAVLSRKWLLEKPETQVEHMSFSAQHHHECVHDSRCVLQLRRLTLSTGELVVVQDDLLHPVLGGNKLRKLDGLLPEVKGTGCTELVRLLQSSH